MAAGDPTGEDLCSVTINATSLPYEPSTGTPDIYTTFTFDSSAVLQSGIKYAIVIGTSGVSSVTNYRVAWSQTLSNDYADGLKAISSDSGVSWTQSPTRDCRFYTQSSGVDKDSYVGSGNADAVQFIYDPYYAAQTFTTGSGYTITGVRLPLYKENFLETGTVIISIRAVSADKASNPSPANTATNVSTNLASISWDAATDAVSYNVYHGTVSGDLTLASEEQAGVSFTLSGLSSGYPYSHLRQIFWRVDSVDAGDGITTGDEWSFTTLRLLIPGPTYWYSTGEYWYQLLVQADGTYGDPPPTGVEDTDYVVVSFDANFIRTARKLVAAANNTIWYEDI